MSSNAGTASLLVLLQLGSRLVTFTLNQALLSYTTPAAFGTATIQLEPLLNTVLFLAREGIRGALARQPPSDGYGRSTQSISRYPLLLGAPLTIAGYWLYAHNASSSVRTQDFFAPAMALYALATTTELASEPDFNRAQIARDVKLRVSIEGSAVIMRAVVTLVVVLYGRERAALLAFGLGQQAYATTLLVRYVWRYRGESPNLDSKSKKEQEGPILNLAYALTKQSFVKQVLTEGDKLIVSRISPIEDQGGYGLALNYGSLVARVMFQPLEESSRLFYSRELGQATEDIQDGSENVRKPSPALHSSLSLLERLCKAQLYLSMIFVFFCPFYTTPLLYHLLGRSRWMATSAPRLLQLYLFLLPFLGFNGILEAFVQAVATEKQLSRMSAALLAWSAVYCASCFAGVQLLGLREESLILANIVSMACRIVYSASFVKTFCRQRGGTFSFGDLLWKAKLPFLSAVVAAVAMRWSSANMPWTTFTGLIKHVLVGMIGFAVFLCASLYAARELVRDLVRKRSDSKQSMGKKHR